MASLCQPSTLRMLLWPDASSARNGIAAVSAEGSTVCVSIRHLNSSCSRSIAFVVRALRRWLGGAAGRRLASRATVFVSAPCTGLEQRRHDPAEHLGAAHVVAKARQAIEGVGVELDGNQRAARGQAVTVPALAQGGGRGCCPRPDLRVAFRVQGHRRWRPSLFANGKPEVPRESSVT
jgi:hypothetical protein